MLLSCDDFRDLLRDRCAYLGVVKVLQAERHPQG